VSVILAKSSPLGIGEHSAIPANRRWTITSDAHGKCTKARADKKREALYNFLVDHKVSHDSAEALAQRLDYDSFNSLLSTCHRSLRQQVFAHIVGDESTAIASAFDSLQRGIKFVPEVLDIDRDESIKKELSSRILHGEATKFLKGKFHMAPISNKMKIQILEDVHGGLGLDEARFWVCRDGQLGRSKMINVVWIEGKRLVEAIESAFLRRNADPTSVAKTAIGELLMHRQPSNDVPDTQIAIIRGVDRAETKWSADVRKDGRSVGEIINRMRDYCRIVSLSLQLLEGWHVIDVDTVTDGNNIFQTLVLTCLEESLITDT